jgi:hypothetical protein
MALPGKYELARLGRLKILKDLNRAGDNGTRCSRPAFMRSAGIVQTFEIKSISDHLAPSASPERAAVRIRNSKASAAIASRSRSLPIKAGTSWYGSAA